MEQYLDKESIKREIDRFDMKKNLVAKWMRRNIESQEELVSLMKKIYMQDISVQNDEKFLECFNEIKVHSENIKEKSLEQYRLVCKEYDEFEEKVYFAQKKENEKELIDEDKQNINEDEDIIYEK